MDLLLHVIFFFFFNDTATTEIYTLSLHDALPIFSPSGIRWAASASRRMWPEPPSFWRRTRQPGSPEPYCLSTDRKSTRLNSSHANISYAVFCLKKKKKSLTYSISIIQYHYYHHVS